MTNFCQIPSFSKDVSSSETILSRTSVYYVKMKCNKNELIEPALKSQSYGSRN